MPSYRRAAAVVLMRHQSGAQLPEIYLARRSQELAFLGGFDAFVGGSVDGVDSAVKQNGSFDDATLRAAALRELFEEVGVLAAPGASSLSADERARWRQRVHRDPAAWGELLRRFGLVLDTAALIPMGRWVTPPYTAIRFDAVYYGLALPPGQEPEVWAGELSFGRWATPQVALAKHQTGELFITFPVLETLRTMVQAGDVQEAAQILCARGKHPYPHAGGEMLAGLHLVPGRTPTLPPATHTNTYVLGGRDLVVVDPATPYEDEQARLLQFLSHLESQGGRVREIWLTHHHADHVGAVACIRQAYGVPVAAHPLCAAALAPEIPVDRLLEDGDVSEVEVAVGQTARWRALHTPGHSRGHLCFFEERLGALLSGDLVLGFGTVLVAPPEGNMQDYLASLARLQQLALGFIFPAHGPPVAAAQRKIAEYVEHRLMRERAVLAALAEHDGHSLEELLPTVYADVDPSAYPLARLSLAAHLDKLVAEHKVALQQGCYRLTESV